jgi:hypothetical protein
MSAIINLFVLLEIPEFHAVQFQGIHSVASLQADLNSSEELA